MVGPIAPSPHLRPCTLVILPPARLCHRSPPVRALLQMCMDLTALRMVCVLAAPQVIDIDPLEKVTRLFGFLGDLGGSSLEQTGDCV